MKTCPPGSWADNLTYTCVSKCTFGYYADNSTWRCVLMCPANPVSFAYTEANNTGVCIPSCPSGFFASDVGRICMPSRCPTRPYFYYRDYQNNQCVLSTAFIMLRMRVSLLWGGFKSIMHQKLFLWILSRLRRYDLYEVSINMPNLY